MKNLKERRPILLRQSLPEPPLPSSSDGLPKRSIRASLGSWEQLDSTPSDQPLESWNKGKIRRHLDNLKHFTGWWHGSYFYKGVKQ